MSKPPTYRMVSTTELRPNYWNPNVMSEEDYARALESIRRFGFVDPITVRNFETYGMEIVDGENRWRAAKDLGLDQVPVIIVDVDEATARQLTIVLNELRGRPDEGKLARIIEELSKNQSLEDLEQVLPFRRAELEAMVATRREGVDWQALASPPVPVVGVPGAKERWVERVFRLPVSAAAVVDDALARAGEDGPIEPWKALELIAADFLGGR